MTIYIHLDKIHCLPQQALGIAVRPAGVNEDVLAVDVTEVAYPPQM